MSIKPVMSSNHLILCYPSLLLPSIFPSIRVFSNVLALCIRWPKYQSFRISSSNEYSRLISFRINWFDSHCSPRDSQESFWMSGFLFFFSFFFSFFCFVLFFSPSLFFLFVVDFVIHWNETAMGLHVFLIPISLPPPSPPAPSRFSQCTRSELS